MSNDTGLILFSPIPVPAGVEEYFERVMGMYYCYGGNFRLNARTTAFGDEHGRGVDGLISWLKSLDWDTRDAAVEVHLLSTDDYTTQDDSMAGRVAPYAPRHDVVVIPKKR